MNGEAFKLIEEKGEVLYNSLMEKPLRVLGIFNDFFGEDNVDMQGCYNLDFFKSWISTQPISTYISDPAEAEINFDDWIKYKTLFVCNLPDDIAIRVINSLDKEAIKDRIGYSFFNDIFILVHFPHVRITNEHNRYVDINHLWARVRIDHKGTMKGGIALNRSEYTMLHFRSDYMHSHVSGIPRHNFLHFQSPCTGSGPINGTINSLNIDYDEDIWNMFCLELSKYVTVESIAGTPYHYLERLGTNDMDVAISRFRTYIFDGGLWMGVLSNVTFKGFVEHFIKLKKLKFNYVNDSFSIGMSLVEFIVLISNEFIKWYNNQFNAGMVSSSFDILKNCRLLKECVIDNGKIYYERGTISINDCAQYIGKKVCTFKGKDITVNITDFAEVKNENKSLILDPSTALYILTTILKVLNYRYGRDKEKHKINQIGTEVGYL